MYIATYYYKKKQRKGKSETNRIGYLQELQRRRVSRGNKTSKYTFLLGFYFKSTLMLCVFKN